MLDMTLKKEEQKDFITNLLLDISGQKYYIVYADGSCEQKDFTIESYNETLLEMEKEYFNYQEAYSNHLKSKRIKDSVKIITADILSIMGVYLSLNIDVEEILRIALSFLIAVIGIFIHQQINNRVHEINDELDEMYLMNEFIKRKEEFALDIVDQNTGEIKKWYAINLSNIYTIASPSSLNKYTKNEYKLKRLPSFLKKDSELENA